MSSPQMMEADLQTRFAQGQALARVINDHAAAVRSGHETLRAIVDGYNELRKGVVLKCLVGRNLTLCTRSRCWKTIKPGHASLLFLEGVCERNGGMGTYGYEDFAMLQRACPECGQSAFDRHGERDDNTSFYAYGAQKGPEGWQAKKFGTWVKIDAKHTLPEPPEHVIDRLALEFGSPQRLVMLVDPSGQVQVILRGSPATLTA